MNKFQRVTEGILHILFPKRCPVCDRVIYTPFWSMEYPVCEECRDRVEYVKEPVCKKCGKPLTDERSEFCRDCTLNPHFFVQGKALWVYKGCVKKSIYRLKYSNRREYGRSYAQELVKHYGGWIRRKEIQAVIPIPLHKKRLRIRGYNQAQIIAEEIGRMMELPVYPKLLIRCVGTKPQKELNDRERRENLKHAFGLAGKPAGLTSVLLVDDIYTTGSTMDGAADILVKAGVKKVYCLSVSIGRGF